MSDEFKPERYKDEYRIQVLAMLDERAKAVKSRWQLQQHHGTGR
jgi:hypothetical protein